MKFKYGNIKVKIDDKKIKDFYNKYNPFAMFLRPDMYLFNENMFTKSNLEAFSKMYDNIPKSLKNYYKDLNKAFIKSTIMKTSKDKVDVDYLNILPATGHDIYNYIARYGLANFQIQVTMKLDGHLDFEKLLRAVRLTIDTQPVFGCRFIENEPPYWKKLKNIDETIFCTLEETENMDGAVQRYLDSPLDMDKDPMVKIKLIRCSDYDTMCIKLNHSCCDGTGTKEFIHLLSEIYSSIDQNEENYIIQPKRRSRIEQDLLFENLGISNPENEWIQGSENTKATWPFPWKQVQSEANRYVIRRFTKEQYNDIIRYSKISEASINDIFLTAYYRAMPELGQPIYDEPMEIPVTIDLRRYLPDNKTEAIRNFSGSEKTRLTLVPDESFIETLNRVIPMMKEIKNSRPGLQSAIGLERIERLSFSEIYTYYQMVSQWPNYCNDKCAPVLSNLGKISNSLLSFGSIIVSDIFVLPPVVQLPGFLLMLSTYNDIITLTAGFYEGTILHEDAEKLLNKIKDEIIQECCQCIN